MAKVRASCRLPSQGHRRPLRHQTGRRHRVAGRRECDRVLPRRDGGKSLDREARLRSFDEATARQEARDRVVAVRGGQGGAGRARAVRACPPSLTRASRLPVRPTPPRQAAPGQRPAAEWDRRPVALPRSPDDHRVRGRRDPTADWRPTLAEPGRAVRETEELCDQFVVLLPDELLIRTALRGMAAYQLAWFDAHMWAYAERYGIPGDPLGGLPARAALRGRSCCEPFPGRLTASPVGPWRRSDSAAWLEEARGRSSAQAFRSGPGHLRGGCRGSSSRRGRSCRSPRRRRPARARPTIRAVPRRPRRAGRVEGRERDRKPHRATPQRIANSSTFSAAVVQTTRGAPRRSEQQERCQRGVGACARPT